MNLAGIRTRASVTTAGCWRWLGATSRGYGQVRVGTGTHRVHRLACELAHGAPPPDHVARHSDACATDGGAGRLCCNPDHLRWGTEAENAADRQRTAHAAARARHGR